jgi:hypothetical protein
LLPSNLKVLSVRIIKAAQVSLPERRRAVGDDVFSLEIPEKIVRVHGPLRVEHADWQGRHGREATPAFSRLQRQPEMLSRLSHSFFERPGYI